MRAAFAKAMGLRRRAIGGAAPTIPANDLIPLNTAQQTDGVYQLSEVNGVPITNHDMLLATPRYIDVAGTGNVGQIAVQVSPDGGTTWRNISGVRLNNNTPDASFNRYVSTGGVLLVGSQVQTQEASLLFRNLNNPDVPTTLEFWNQEGNAFLGGGVFNDGTHGQYAVEAHNMIRFVGYDSAFTVQAFTAGLLEVTGWRGHQRRTLVYPLSASVAPGTIAVPAGYTLGQVIHNLNLSAAQSFFIQARTGAGTLKNGASDYSVGYNRKGISYVKHYSSIPTAGNGSSSAPNTNKSNDIEGFQNFFNLHVPGVPFMAQGYCFHTTDGASQNQSAVGRFTDEVTHLDLTFGGGATGTGTIWVVFHKRKATVIENEAYGSDNNFEYTDLIEGNKDGNNLIVATSYDLGLTASAQPGLQARLNNGTWLDASHYPRVMFYSIGDSDNYDNLTHGADQSSTDNGMDIAIWNATWFDKQGNRGARPSWFGTHKHPSVSSLGNGARTTAGCIVTGTNLPIDQYRFAHTAASAVKFTGTGAVVKYEMG